MKVLLIGLGSIGKRHAGVLKQLVPTVEITALRSNKTAEAVPGIQSVFDWSEITAKPDFIIIANATVAHAESIKKAAQFGVPLFVEKPVVHDLSYSAELLSAIKVPVYVACNLRFLAAIQFIQQKIATEKPKIEEVNCYCGSYLPDWRVGQSYKAVYSSQAALGGGVHLDMIHELDYCLYIFGIPNSTRSFFKNKSNLGIDAIDSAHYVLDYGSFFTYISLNYFRRDKKRELEIVTDSATFKVDLLENTVTCNGLICFQSAQTGADTYFAQMQYFLATIAEQGKFMNDLNESLQVLKAVF